MPETETTGKELLDESLSIESEQFDPDLDNVITEKTGKKEDEAEVEAEVAQGKDPLKEGESTETEEKADKEAEEEDNEDPEIDVEGNRLVARKEGVSLDVDSDFSGPERGDTVEDMETTDEEKQVAKEQPRNPTDIFAMETGATRVSGEDSEDVVQPALTDSNQSEQAEKTDSVLDSNVKTGATKVISKPKRILFSAILGLKRAKKGIGNFFKKKLPKAIETGGKMAMGVLRKTPLAPAVKLIDMAMEYRERTRPERERKAQLKKEEKEKKQAQWLLDQDEKRRKKEEQERLEKEKAELKAKLKAELKEKKRLEEAGKKPGFFKKMWNGIKTGVFWLGRKIKQSKAADFAVKSVKTLKELFVTAKAKIGGMLDTVVTKVTDYVDQTKDEFDEYSFEDRMTRVTEEENKKKQNGDPVPEQDYRTRYLALTEELKVRLADVRKNITRREEIESALSEMEGMDSDAVKLKDGFGEEVSRKEWTDDVAALDTSSEIASTVISAIGAVVEKTPIGNHPLVETIVSLGKMGSEINRAALFKQRKELMDAIHSTAKDQLVKRMSRYVKDNAEVRYLEAGFDAAILGLTAFEGVGKTTGVAPLAAGASLIKNITTGVKMLVTSSKTRAGVKNGIKEMLGGKEGYYGLKAKYRMHAPEMRRAVRDALGVATSEDAVTADKWELSHLMHERTKNGNMDIETERMVAEAGGSSERHFDTLQGAASKIKRRNADRRRRMTA